jgi:hypothetical protein
MLCCAPRRHRPTSSGFPPPPFSIVDKLPPSALSTARRSSWCCRPLRCVTGAPHRYRLLQIINPNLDYAVVATSYTKPPFGKPAAPCHHRTPRRGKPRRWKTTFRSRFLGARMRPPPRSRRKRTTTIPTTCPSRILGQRRSALFATVDPQVST